MKYFVVHTYLEEGYNPKVMQTSLFKDFEQAKSAVKEMVKDERETQLYEYGRETFTVRCDNDTYLSPVGNEYCYYDWWHIYDIKE